MNTHLPKIIMPMNSHYKNKVLILYICAEIPAVLLHKSGQSRNQQKMHSCRSEFASHIKKNHRNSLFFIGFSPFINSFFSLCLMIFLNINSLTPYISTEVLRTFGKCVKYNKKLNLFHSYIKVETFPYILSHYSTPARFYKMLYTILW